MLMRRVAPLDAFDGHRSFALQLLFVPVLLLLLAIFEPRAVVRLKHAMFATEVTLAETTVADNPLRRVLAVLETASDLLWTTTPEWKCRV